MKRFILLTAAALAAFGTVGVTPAKADHHPACHSLPIVQTISVVENGANLDFSGSVKCLGAESASITKLYLKQLAGATVMAPLTSSASCSNCTAAITAAGSAPGSAGLFELMMNFEATDSNTGRTYKPFRMGWYLYVPGAVLVQICGHGNQLACPTTLP